MGVFKMNQTKIVLLLFLLMNIANCVKMRCRGGGLRTRCRGTNCTARCSSNGRVVLPVSHVQMVEIVMYNVDRKSTSHPAFHSVGLRIQFYTNRKDMMDWIDWMDWMDMMGLSNKIYSSLKTHKSRKCD